MDGQQERFEELDLQLDAIQDALAMARQEPGRERQAELMAVARRAFEAYDRAHQAAVTDELAKEQPRPIFVVLKGGLAAVGAFLLAARIRTGGLWQSHQTAVLGGATGALAAVVGLVLYLTLWDGPVGEVDGRAGGRLRPTAMAPVSTPTRTAPPTPTATASSPAPSPTPSATGPSTAVPALSPIAVPAPMGDATTRPGPGASSPGATTPPGSPGPSGSPGGTTPPPEGSTPPPPGGEQSDGGRCAVTLPVPLIDARLGNLLCL